MQFSVAGQFHFQHTPLGPDGPVKSQGQNTCNLVKTTLNDTLLQFLQCFCSNLIKFANCSQNSGAESRLTGRFVRNPLPMGFQTGFFPESRAEWEEAGA